MHRSRLLVTVVVLLAVGLAGCSQTWSDPATSTQDTVTPVPVPDDTGPAGIDGDDIDPVVLAIVHTETLETTSYTIEVHQRVVGPGGASLRESTRYREVAPGARRYWGYVRYEFNATALQEFGTTGYWSNETHVATRYDSPVRPSQTRLWRAETEPVNDHSNGDQLINLLRAVDPSVTDRADNGSVLLTGTVASPTGQFRTPPSLTDLRNVSGRFQIRADGRIERWQITYTATFENRPVTIVRTGRLLDIGATTVEQPAWAANATVVAN
jgi:hypothetical protein